MVEQGEPNNSQALQVVPEGDQAASIAIVPEENNYLQFPEGVRIEHGDNAAYVYNETGDRRWFIQDYTGEQDKKRHMMLNLSGKTAGGTWHLLMGAYQAMDSDTREVCDSGVNIDVLMQHSPLLASLNMTPVRNIQYADSRAGEAYQGWEVGEHGQREDIKSDLQEYGALGIHQQDLPEKIDVQATMQQLANAFQEGSFEPPQFIVSKEIKKRHKLGTAMTTIYQRLHKGSTERRYPAIPQSKE